MLRLALALCAALALALAACNSDEETVSDTTSGSTPTTIGDAITICGRIGVPGEATPSSPTPESSCEPGSDFAAPPGIHPTVTDAPGLPAGTTALTRYIELNSDDPDTAGVISMPLVAELDIGRDIAWYTYDSGQWMALEVTPVVHKSTIPGQDTLVEGSFNPLPANLILLAEN